MKNFNIPVAELYSSIPFSWNIFKKPDHNLDVQFCLSRPIIFSVTPSYNFANYIWLVRIRLWLILATLWLWTEKEFLAMINIPFFSWEFCGLQQKFNRRILDLINPKIDDFYRSDLILENINTNADLLFQDFLLKNPEQVR